MAAFLGTLLTSLPSPSLWWRMALGQWMLQHLNVMHQNLFSFAAPTHPWVNHEWALDVMIFWCVDRLGLSWWVWLRALSVALLVGFSVRTLRRRGGILPTFLLTGLLWLSLQSLLPLEPLLVSALFLASCLNLLESPRWTGLPALVVVPLLCWFWASLHGAVLVGLVLLWLYSAGEVWDAMRRRADARWVLHPPLALLATLFALWNPYYAGIFELGLEELWQLLSSGILRLQLLSSHDLALGGALMGVVGLTLLAVGSEVRWRLALPWLLLTPIVLLMPGYVGLWGVWGVVTLMEHIQQVARRVRHEPRLGLLSPLRSRPILVMADSLHRLSAFETRCSTGMVGVLLMGLLSWAWLVPHERLGPLWPEHSLMAGSSSLDALAAAHHMPVKAVDALIVRSKAGTRVLAPLEWSGYVLWAGQGQLQIFVDSRENAYPLGVLEDYDRIRGMLPGWEELLDSYEVDFVVWKKDSFLPQALETSGGWQVHHQGTDAVVLEKRRSQLPAPPDVTDPAEAASLKLNAQSTDVGDVTPHEAGTQSTEVGDLTPHEAGPAGTTAAESASPVTSGSAPPTP